MKIVCGSAEPVPDRFNAIVGANIRALRQRKGWSQAQLGALMGWPTNATVCAAEGRRGGRQRRFSTDELCRLAAVFDVPPWHLTTGCENCQGNPPVGFACLMCGTSA